MTSRRRLLLTTRNAALALTALPWTAWSQDNKPLEWVVGYAPGGGSDVVARVVGEQIAKTLGRPVVINNKPGAATNIAADYVAKSKDLGNVALTADFAMLAANPSLFAKLPYDSEKDFAPVGLIARFPLLLVAVDTAIAQQYVSSGKLKAFAVASAARLKTLPDVPTLDELGLKGFEAYAWQGLVVPVATPPAFVAQLNQALVAALSSTSVKARFQTLGLDALPGTPDEMTRYARRERERWGQLIRSNGIHLD
jgi:tripartite-type tricarboxylate transporter receptor subunit TctC